MITNSLNTCYWFAGIDAIGRMKKAGNPPKTLTSKKQAGIGTEKGGSASLSRTGKGNAFILR